MHSGKDRERERGRERKRERGEWSGRGAKQKGVKRLSSIVCCTGKVNARAPCTYLAEGQVGGRKL